MLRAEEYICGFTGVVVNPAEQQGSIQDSVLWGAFI